jgi:hypothetical protein
MSRKDVFDKIVSEWAGTEHPYVELAALVSLQLGELEQRKFSALTRIQDDLRSRQQALADQLEVGQTTPEEYLVQLQAALQTAMTESRAVLGEKQFVALFGEAGCSPEGLVDKQTFLQKRAELP